MQCVNVGLYIPFIVYYRQSWNRDLTTWANADKEKNARVWKKQNK